MNLIIIDYPAAILEFDPKYGNQLLKVYRQSQLIKMSG